METKQFLNTMYGKKVHYTYKRGFSMKRKLIAWFVIWYRKWIIGECRHFCSSCRFNNECKHDTEWWLDISTLGYYDKDNYGECKKDKEMR